MHSEFSRTKSIRLFGSLVALLVATSSTHAAGSLFRSYLSVNGLDTNPCTLPKPCRLLPAALATTASGGEVWMLDSGNFNTGTVTINQSVTILAVPGALGSVIANNADAIDIPTSNISVTLRNLLVRNLSGTANNGVYVTGAGAQLFVEHSEFNGLFEGVDTSAASAKTQVMSSVFHGNSKYDIATEGANSSAAEALVEHCTIIGTINAGTIGATHFAIFGSNANIAVSHSSITHSDRAIYSDVGSIITLEDDVIAHNIYGATVGNGTINTTRSNTFKFNQQDVTLGSLTTVPHT